MSSKRKSPPTKLQEGNALSPGQLSSPLTEEQDASEGGGAAAATATAATTAAKLKMATTCIAPAGNPNRETGLFSDVEENSSDVNEDVDNYSSETRGHRRINLKIKDNHGKEVTENYSKNSDNYNSEENRSCSVSSRSMSGSESDDNSVTPPTRRKRRASPKTPPEVQPSAVALWNLQQQYERFYQTNHIDSKTENQRRRSSSECNSPVSNSEKHNNNNNNTISNNNNNNNNNNSGHLKRTMDDVLKRLTSKMNNSSVREEKRPTPASTPNSKNR
ncbi:hypothetical protein RUM43_006198 [Polyplax serrata]|uniref:Uncharacterized protein n=1 Tax=Polyplax serrata TaxID=468196 RepID=A0AAN8S8Z4_POLSC